MEFEFSSNLVVESLDKVPEKYRGMYGEITDGDDAGKFGLLGAAKPLAEAYDGVSGRLKSVEADKKKVSNEAAQRRVATKAIEELAVKLGIEVDDASKIAEAIDAHITDLSTRVKNGDEIKVNMDKIQADAEKRIAEALGAKDKELGAMRSTLETHLIGETATKAIGDAKGSVDLLMPLIKQQAKVFADGDKYAVRIVDSDGEARSNGAGGWMTVSDLVTEMKSNDSLARAFESEAPGGTGSPPGSAAARAGQHQKSADMNSTQKIASGLAKGQHQTPGRKTA